MNVTPGAVVLLLIAFLHLSNATIDIKQIYESPLSHGFGEDIEWVKWEDAVETALEKNKPIFLLIHKSWCHACKALKKTFQQSNARKAFKILSEYFVMVNTEDDEEPYEEEYRPDGKYIPRLLFLDKNGDLLPEFVNKKAEYKNYAYYYSSPADVLNSMKDVLESFDIEVPEMKKGERLKRRPRSDDEKSETLKADAKKAKGETNANEEKKGKEKKSDVDEKDAKKDKKPKEEKSGDKKDKKTEL
uniref:Thioredoxin domain-containing protein 12 n=1 Tax=Ascaris suum TaxID=6253 RepID=F1LCK7_ASCSU